VFYSGKFDYASWWHNGFPAYNDPGYEEWVSEGSPAWPNGGYQRNITLSDSTGYLVSGGCSIRIYKGLELDLEARYMQADVDAHYTLSYYGTVVDDRGKSNFPLDNTAYQASLKYSF